MPLDHTVGYPQSEKLEYIKTPATLVVGVNNVNTNIIQSDDSHTLALEIHHYGIIGVTIGVQLKIPELSTQVALGASFKSNDKKKDFIIINSVLI